MEIEKKICYICNPSLNSSCGKGGCGWINNNGECFLTTDENCALRIGDIPISENVVIRLINSVTTDPLISRKIEFIQEIKKSEELFDKVSKAIKDYKFNKK